MDVGGEAIAIDGGDIDLDGGAFGMRGIDQPYLRKLRTAVEGREQQRARQGVHGRHADRPDLKQL